MDDKPVLLNYQQAAAYLTMSPFTLRRLASRGEIACTKLGRKMVRFTVGQLDSFIAAGAREPRS